MSRRTIMSKDYESNIGPKSALPNHRPVGPKEHTGYVIKLLKVGLNIK